VGKFAVLEHIRDSFLAPLLFRNSLK